jgi:hypothetical protein
LNGASNAFGRNLVHEQEVLNNLSDMITELYMSESTALRVKKMESIKGESSMAVYKQILDVMIYDAASKIEKNGIDAVNSFASGEEAQNLIAAIKALTTLRGVNVKVARRVIADKLIEDNSYKF